MQIFHSRLVVRIAVAFCLLCLFAGHARAQSFYAKSLPSGSISLSLGQSDIPGLFVNWMKNCFGQTFSGGASPNSLDANGYPNNAAIAAGGNIACEINLPSSYTGTWEYGFSGTGYRLLKFFSGTVTSDPQGCWNSSTKVVSGTNCDIVFTSPGTQINPEFDPATYSGMSNEFFIRSTDKAAYLAGQVITPEALSIISAANPPWLRTMGMRFPLQTQENEPSWAYRTPNTADTWVNDNWFPNAWSSSITGTDQYTASGAPNTPAQWTDGEVLQGNFPNVSAAALNITGAAQDSGNGEVQLTVATTTLSTNQQVLIANCETNAPPTVYTITVESSTTLDLQGTTYSSAWNSGAACPQSGSSHTGQLTTTTINIASRGAKFVAPMGVLGSPSITVGPGTVVYNAILNLVLYSPGGIHSGVPVEARAALANEANLPLWDNFPPLYSPSSVTSEVSYLSGALKTDLWTEYDNENWNFAWAATQFKFQSGLELGLSTQQLNTFVGYKIVTLQQAATSAWTKGASSLHRVGAWQLFGPASDFSTYQMKGQLLCGTSCSNSTYQSLIGTDYNSAPNRPYDYTDDYSVATYFNGAQLSGNVASTLTQINGTCNGSSCTGAIAAASCYASPSNATCGTGGTAQLALQFVDNDTQSGVLIGSSGCAEVGGQPNQTLACLPSQFTIWNTQASTDSRPLVAYEGGFQSYGPSAAFLAGLGDASSTTDATNINNLLIAYRSSPLFYTTYTLWNTDWMTNSKVTANANLQLENNGGSININSQYWGLLGSGYINPVLYENFQALGVINGNYP